MIPVGNDGARPPLDTWPTGDLLEVLWASQSGAIAAVQSALPALQRAVDGAVVRLAAGRRVYAGGGPSGVRAAAGLVVFAGAGSSGMIAALGALELGAPFSWPEDRALVLVAGGFDLGRG